jgi:cytochrome P450
LQRMLLNLNPPHHTRLRALLMKAFNARQIERLRQTARDTASRLLDKLIASGQGDLAADYAHLLPMEIICALLDVPREEASAFRSAARNIVRTMDVNPMSAGQLDESEASMETLQRYFRKVIGARREHPGEDLISQLIAVREGDLQLTEDEIIENIILLFIAGHETTSNMIGNALIALYRHPEQLARARSDSSLLPAVVTECMRYDSSAQMIVRVALEDLEIEGVAIKSGSVVYLCLGSANRDPEAFADPDCLMIERPANGRRVLSLGGGIHFCLGARLAMLEMEAALSTLFARLPAMRITNLDDLRWYPRNAIRGVASLRFACP